MGFNRAGGVKTWRCVSWEWDREMRANKSPVPKVVMLVQLWVRVAYLKPVCISERKMLLFRDLI